MMKKTFCMILSLLMLFSLSTAAIAASCASSPFAVSPIMQPLAVVYEDDDIRTSQGTYQTQPFTCVSGNGNSLRYWFKNNSGAACTVQLYKKTILGLGIHPTSLHSCCWQQQVSGLSKSWEHHLCDSGYPCNRRHNHW